MEKQNILPSNRRFIWASLAFFSLLLFPLWAHAAPNNDLFSRALRAYGWGAALPTAFLVGLGTAATPCVYPMIAITVAVFGARKATRAEAIKLSTSFVLGISAFFVPLGLLAGMTGALAGELAGSTPVLIFEAVLMFAMAASMFGLFEINLPSSVQTRLATIGGFGLKGAFLVGFVLGPIAAPCATAGLVGILDYVFRSKNGVFGALSLFVYAMGLGLPFFIVGAFAVGLPKPGRWMEMIKHAFGIVMLIMGLVYLRPLIRVLEIVPKLPGMPWILVLIIVAGLAVGAVHLSFQGGRVITVRKITGIAVTALAGMWLVNYEPPRKAGSCGDIQWQTDPTQARVVASRERRPMLIDFGARWCRACEELAHKTFSDGQVACEVSTQNFVPVMVYQDRNPPPNYNELRRQYQVRALPTVIVLNSAGTEVARVNEFIPAESMLAVLRRAQ